MRRGHYAGPVILASDMDTACRTHDIIIPKEQVYKDIDRITFKHVDSHEDMGIRTSNAISADTEDGLDRSLVSESVAYYDAQIRIALQTVLGEQCELCSDNPEAIQNTMFVYHLLLPRGVNSNIIAPLTEFIRRYLVYGALYDWYSRLGMAQAQWYEKELAVLKSKITGALKGPSIQKRPMQPFGPAEKIF